MDRAAALTRWRESAETFNRGVNLMELLFFGLHLITPDETDVMLRVNEELQAQRSKMIDQTRAVQDALRSTAERAQAAGRDTHDAPRGESKKPHGRVPPPRPSLSSSETQP